MLVLTAPAEMPRPSWLTLGQQLIAFVDGAHDPAEMRVVRIPVGAAAGLRDVLADYPGSSWVWEWTEDAAAAAGRAEAFADDLRDLIGAGTNVDAVELAADLLAAGFTRKLLPAQEDAVGRMLRAQSSGNFSVPGSGKTTMTYAVYALMRGRADVDRMLVVAPQSAYEAWADEADACFAEPPAVEIAARAPRRGTEVAVVNYERLADGATRASIDGWATGHRLLVVFDEAHRAKRGATGLHGMAARDVADLAARRIVLTGTPMPNGPADFEAILDLAWPGHGASLAADPASADRLWVRITKDDLGLEPVEIHVETIDLDPVHRRVYEAALGRLLESDDSARAPATTQLIAAASNPTLLLADAEELTWSGPILTGSLRDVVEAAAASSRPAKLLVAARHAHEHAARGAKLLIWTNFLGNVRELKRLLEPLSPAVITGATPVSEPAAPTDRARELLRFREDPRCSVLIATPQTLGEGVSLHRVCQSQLYVDRTFNAGLYLQALDRTHRVGMPAETTAKATILIANDTVDERIDDALRRKIKQMDASLSDPGLHHLSGVAEPNGVAVSDGEARALVEHLLRRRNDVS
ncbi:DEAD/DEAH box helicase [Curtobacterium sp. MCLR17_040]|uniref:SNF2-related protein n=1 Tax=Curtobacterium sp. MCLR17_040 TaxID=2175625 RepID=UPI0011B551C5|nr:DEAD/DEAH box helicase [Curtobacterium sp. MCLR17_040]